MAGAGGYAELLGRLAGVRTLGVDLGLERMRLALARLGDPQAPHGNSYAYELFDTRPSNIRALVMDRYVVGTGDIDRVHFAMPWEAIVESDRFMWVADRIPILRFPLVRDTFIVAFAAATALGVRRLSHEWK